MPLLHHYTDGAGAQDIIRSGKINASLNYMMGGDTAFGNGVYLTENDPSTYTKAEIAMNNCRPCNWMDDSEEFIRKTENCFVIDIPSSRVEDNSADGRNIFLYGWQNDLRLRKYRWWLMDFDSRKIITSYSFTLISVGPASKVAPHLMRDYKMTDETVNGRPVYRSTDTRGSYYLFMDSNGNWVVRSGDFRDEDEVDLVQWNNSSNSMFINYSLGPDPDLAWQYYDDDDSDSRGFMDDDATLKCLAWQV